MRTRLGLRTTFLMILALIFLLSCVSMDERLRLAAFEGDVIAVDDLTT